jgi:hypothetical protein
VPVRTFQVESHCIRLRRVIAFTIQPIYPRERAPRCPLDIPNAGLDMYYDTKLTILAYFRAFKRSVLSPF